jgi:uncharacterized protein (DUF2252 family)
MALSRSVRDPLSLIEDSNKGRVKNLLPIRFTRMLESPFAFFRGTAIVQAHDLKSTPATGIVVQSCGDCHLMNFSVFASPERTLIFDINDFDETLPAPFEWDLKRLASSFVLASRWRKFDKHEARDASRAVVKAYREQMGKFAEMSMLDVWYARVAVDDLIDRLGREREVRKQLNRVVDSAHKQTSEAVFHKMTRDVTLPADRRVLIDRYELVDAAFKVVGVGSVGTHSYMTLLMADVDDPLFLQVKQALPSVLEGPTGCATCENNGERVVIGQRVMQSASDIFLGWTRGPQGEDFYVRQLRDQKVAPDLATTTEGSLALYAKLCGQALARAHAKSGKAAEISGYLGSGKNFDYAVSDYAISYADQVEKDYEAFRVAVRAGRFPTETSASAIETAIR